MLWDYDRFFNDGNILGVKNTDNGFTYIWQIDSKSCNKTPQKIKKYYANPNLSIDDDFIIQWIVRLDVDGYPDRIFDRERDIPYFPMPELKTGMFGKVMWWDRENFEEDSIEFGKFVVVENYAIYQNGGYDHLNNLSVFPQKNEIGAVVIEIYDSESFDNDRTVIWTNPAYTAWLEKQNDKKENN